MVQTIARRRLGAVTLGACAAVLTGIKPALAYNCVNVVLRDPYWGQFRHIIEQGWNAAGVAPALGRSGFQVDAAPSVGAVMSWPAGQYGASGVGHVGVVTALNENGTVQVLHENWPYGSAAHLQTFTVRPGMLFVHVPPKPAPAAEAVVDAPPVVESAHPEDATLIW